MTSSLAQTNCIVAFELPVTTYCFWSFFSERLLIGPAELKGRFFSSTELLKSQRPAAAAHKDSENRRKTFFFSSLKFSFLQRTSSNWRAPPTPVAPFSKHSRPCGMKSLRTRCSLITLGELNVPAGQNRNLLFFKEGKKERKKF